MTARVINILSSASRALPLLHIPDISLRRRARQQSGLAADKARRMAASLRQAAGAAAAKKLKATEETRAGSRPITDPRVPSAG